MKILKMFKVPFQTQHFNKNQKVWVRRITGAMAAEVIGKFRGNGRYVTAWIKWENKKIPDIKEIEVNDLFFNKIMAGVIYPEGYFSPISQG